MTDKRPLLIVTNLVAPDRVGAFASLAARTPIELALFAGRSHHATAAVDDPGVPHRHVRQRELFALARSGRYRAVACGTTGRIALPAAWLGARAARVPFILWTALWSHPRTLAFRFGGTPLLHTIYRNADAIVTYGPHVNTFLRDSGISAARIVVAPQAVENSFWSAPVADPVRAAPFTALAVGRAARYKGEPELLSAWRSSGLRLPDAALVIVGDRPATTVDIDSVKYTGALEAAALRRRYAGSDLLVMAAIATPQTREPWGLVANEAMSCGLPVIATDAVGAAAGGLVRDGQTGLVVTAGDVPALAAALHRLATDPVLRARLGAAARVRVAAYSFDAWADGWLKALAICQNPPR